MASYAEADRHPVKDVVRDVAAEVGWSAAAWAEALPQLTVPLADVDRASAAARAAGLVDERAEVVEVAFPELDAADLVRWRLGMAQLAPFVARLDPPARQRLVERAVARLGSVLRHSSVTCCCSPPASPSALAPESVELPCDVRAELIGICTSVGQEVSGSAFGVGPPALDSRRCCQLSGDPPDLQPGDRFQRSEHCSHLVQIDLLAATGSCVRQSSETEQLSAARSPPTRIVDQRRSQSLSIVCDTGQSRET